MQPRRPLDGEWLIGSNATHNWPAQPLHIGLYLIPNVRSRNRHALHRLNLVLQLPNTSPHVTESQAILDFRIDLLQHGSLARPGRNATGVNFYSNEVLAKRLELLRGLVPRAIRVAVLVNPANAMGAETTVREVQKAARAIGLQSQILNATT